MASAGPRKNRPAKGKAKPGKSASDKTRAGRIAAGKAEPGRAGPAKAAKAKEGGGSAPKLLSGGNPQIAKAYGDAPVQEYIAAMPGWKSAMGKRLDALIERAVPQVCKAVKWNSPLYGLEGRGWFLGIHTFTHYVKVAFFRGALLNPVPPGPSRQKDPRYLDIRENDVLDEEQFMSWVRQAAELPGEKL